MPQSSTTGPTWPQFIEYELLTDHQTSDIALRVAALELALTDRKARRALRRLIRRGQRDFASVSSDPVWVRAEAAFNEYLCGVR